MIDCEEKIEKKDRKASIVRGPKGSTSKSSRSVAHQLVQVF